MSLENERKGNQNEGVKDLLNEEHKAELGKILVFGEKYKKEGEGMKKEFWEKYDKNKGDHFRYLLLGYKLSKDKFMEGLPQEEKKLLNNLNDIAKDKFCEEYSHDKIIYGGKISLIVPKIVGYNDWEKGGLKSLKEWAGKLKERMQPGMVIGFDNNFFGDEGIEVLAEEWKDSLKPGMKIDFQHNNIGAEGVEVLAKEWKHSLQPGMVIGLSNNHIGDEGVEILAKEWKHSLQPGIEIGLQSNDIGAEGVKALAREWKDSLKSGMSIELGYNGDIGAEGVKALVMEWKDSLQPGMSLDLSLSKMGAEGAQAIMENLVLKEGVKLYLRWNDIPKEWEDKLEGWVQGYKDKGINCDVIV